MELVSGIHKVPFHGFYLPLSIAVVLISVKNYLSLAIIYPGLPPVLGMLIAKIKVYLSSCTSAKQMGILTCEENITFDGASESCPVFGTEMTGFLIKPALLQLLSFAFVGGSGVTPPPPTYIFSLSGLERYLRRRLISFRFGGQCMKGIKTVWTCVPGSKLDMRVRLSWIPSGDSMGIKLGHLSLSPAGRLENTSNNYRFWLFCG